MKEKRNTSPLLFQFLLLATLLTAALSLAACEDGNQTEDPDGDGETDHPNSDGDTAEADGDAEDGDGETEAEEEVNHYGQVEITEAMPLLKPDGSLNAIGWARHPVIEYNPAYITEELGEKLKEWEHYTIQTPDFVFEVTLANITVLTFASVVVIDYRTDEKFSGFDFGNAEALSFPGSPYGDTTWERYDNLLTVRNENGRRTISFNIPGKFEDPDFQGEVVLYDDPADEGLVVAQPFFEPGLFFFEDKVFGMAAEGEVRVGDRTFIFEPDKSASVLDWGRGIWPTDTWWYWAFGAGEVDGKRVAFNVGPGCGDTSKGSADGIVLDGVIHKVHGFEGSPWQYDPENLMEPWHLLSVDGKLDLTMEPFHHALGDVDLGIYYMTNDKLHGSFHGTLTLDDGRVLAVENFVGFVEHSIQSW